MRLKGQPSNAGPMVLIALALLVVVVVLAYLFFLGPR
jgi:hypothetical protein